MVSKEYIEAYRHTLETMVDEHDIIMEKIIVSRLKNRNDYIIDEKNDSDKSYIYRNGNKIYFKDVSDNTSRHGQRLLMYEQDYQSDFVDASLSDSKKYIDD